MEDIQVTESQFADDVAVYATTREALETAATEFVYAASKWCLTVSTMKTKGMAVGRELEHTDVAPIHLDAGSIEFVQDFTYIGSSITSDGEVNVKVKSHIRKATRAFGYLQKSIFQNKYLSVETKRVVYKAAVLSILLYGAETWAIKAESLRRMHGFHNHCIRTMLGMTKFEQWKKCIRSDQLAWGRRWQTS